MNNRTIMMKFIVILFLFFVYTSCKTDNKQEKSIKIYALMMCDLTSSVDSNLIKDVAHKAHDLLLALPQGSKVEAYPIDDNTYLNPIFSGELPLLESDLDFHKDMFKGKLNALAENLGNAIYFKYKDVNLNKSTQHASCIISSLETAYNFFKDKDKNTYRFELIYFSDMIEQCSNSQAGSIFICSDRHIPNKESIIAQIEKKYNPNMNLKSLIDNNISMIITTGIMGDSKCLRSDEQKEIWQKIFSKVGYSQSDFASFHFRQGLPDRFSISNSK